MVGWRARSNGHLGHPTSAWALGVQARHRPCIHRFGRRRDPSHFVDVIVESKDRRVDPYAHDNYRKICNPVIHRPSHGKDLGAVLFSDRGDMIHRVGEINIHRKSVRARRCLRADRATSDPTFGQGLSLALRDARVLRHELSRTCDWESAGNDYAEKHRKYFGVAHTVEGWFRTLFQDPSPKAALLRADAMPRIAEDPSRVPDHLFSGPQHRRPKPRPSDKAHKR